MTPGEQLLLKDSGYESPPTPGTVGSSPNLSFGWVQVRGISVSVQYDSASKKGKLCRMSQRGRALMTLCSVKNKPDAKGQMPCDSIPMRSLEESNSQTEGKAWLPGVAGGAVHHHTEPCLLLHNKHFRFFYRFQIHQHVKSLK